MNYDLKNFESDVLKRSHKVPVLVDFWAPWCGPCKVLSPILERLVAAAAGRWVLVKVNTEEHPDLAERYEIASIPNIKLFRKGEVADEFLGALPESEIRRWLNKAIPSPHAATVARAQALLAEGAVAKAIKLLNPVLEAEPDNEPARILLAECLLAVDPSRVAATLQVIGTESEYAERAEVLRTLARVALAAEHPEQLPESKVRERYLAGARSIRKGDYASALEAFIEVIEKMRDYDNSGAQEAGKAIFKLLGVRHPIAERYYRAFTSALYS
jgi:putative thioredoxin